jgi:alpha-ketoglutarate-dependent taurine dioxygenase
VSCRSSLMAIELTPLHPTLGVELRGVDLTRPVTPEVFAEIEAAFHRYGILVFPEPAADRRAAARVQPLLRAARSQPELCRRKVRLRPDVTDI